MVQASGPSVKTALRFKTVFESRTCNPTVPGRRGSSTHLVIGRDKMSLAKHVCSRHGHFTFDEIAQDELLVGGRDEGSSYYVTLKWDRSTVPRSFFKNP